MSHRLARGNNSCQPRTSTGSARRITQSVHTGREYKTTAACNKTRIPRDGPMYTTQHACAPGQPQVCAAAAPVQWTCAQQQEPAGASTADVWPCRAAPPVLPAQYVHAARNGVQQAACTPGTGRGMLNQRPTQQGDAMHDQNDKQAPRPCQSQPTSCVHSRVRPGVLHRHPAGAQQQCSPLVVKHSPAHQHVSKCSGAQQPLGKHPYAHSLLSAEVEKGPLSKGVGGLESCHSIGSRGCHGRASSSIAVPAL
jgi:hypothetical protein